MPVRSPNDLMYWTDGYRPVRNATIGGRALTKVAVQYKWPRFTGRISNHIYNIDGTKEIVYAPRESYPAVMKMGLTMKQLLSWGGRAVHSIPTEDYYEQFVGNPNFYWLRLHRYELV